MQQLTPLSWDDFRFVLAVSRAGSVRAAAKRLGVNHATVWRRVDALQDALGTKLFARVGRRWTLTDRGAIFVELATEVETKALELERKFSGGDEDREGRVRVALPNSFVPYISPALRSLRQEHPAISIELVTSLSLASLSQREADVAIRLVHEPHETLVGKRVGALELVLCGHAELLASMRGRALADLPWVSWPSDVDWELLRMERALRGQDAVVATADSPEGLLHLVDSQLGVGYVQRPLANARAHLLVLAEAPVLSTPIWVLTHDDSRRVGRVRIVMKILGEHLARTMPTSQVPLKRS